MEVEMTTTFVDPRTRPVPPAPSHRPPADTREAVAPLLEAINAGRIYDVERWIEGGGALQFEYSKDRRSSPASPMQAAIETGQHDVVHLLLCNGYRLDLERRAALTEALKCRRTDIVGLLLDWGADPWSADPSLVVSSYDAELVERFWRMGVDLARHRAFAEELAFSSTNRPLYGFFRRYAKEDPALQRALNHGLCLAVEGSGFGDEGGEGGAALCQWAGADPYAQVPELREEDDEEEDDAAGDEESRWSPYRCAAGIAVSRGKLSILEAMKLKANSPHFQRLYEMVHRPDVYDFLYALEPPRDPEPIAHRAMSGLGFDMSWSRWDLEGLMVRVLARGGRLTSRLPDRACRSLQSHLRSKLSTLGGSWFRGLFGRLQDPTQVEESVFLQIIQSPKIIENYKAFGIRKEFIEKVAANETASSSVRAAARRLLRVKRRGR
jgi:hypothetical protein